MIVAARFPAPCVGTLAVIAVTRRGRYATTPEKRVEELNPSCAAGRFFSQRPVKTIYRSIDEYTTASANLAAKAQRQAGTGYHQYSDQYLYQKVGLICVLPTARGRSNAKA